MQYPPQYPPNYPYMPPPSPVPVPFSKQHPVLHALFIAALLIFVTFLCIGTALFLRGW